MIRLVVNTSAKLSIRACEVLIKSLNYVHLNIFIDNKVLHMIVIRLNRGGSKKRPFYNIVVADRRNARDGRFIERLGYFNPLARGAEQRIVLDLEKVEAWVAKGAQPSDRVKRIIKDHKKQAEVEPTQAA